MSTTVLGVEADRIAERCRWVRLAGFTDLPVRHFRAFLVATLEARGDGLAQAVSSLSDEDAGRLLSDLCGRQAFADDLVYG